jgi:hypothetical protein
VTDAAAHDGARLREGLIDPNNTASEVWADSAYRSAENERFLAGMGKVSRIRRRKGECPPETIARDSLRCRAVPRGLCNSLSLRISSWHWTMIGFS